MDGGDFPQQKVFFEGRHYDAYSFAKKLVRKAAKSIVLVDGYCDDVTLDILSNKRGGADVTIATVAKTPKKRVRPTDAELLDDEDDGGRRIPSSEIKKLRAMLDEDEKNTSTRPPIDVAAAGAEEPESAPPAASTNAPAVSNPFVQKEKKEKRLIPETYTVEEGDTLMRISARFYGTNRKWREIREANKTIISSDGRVKTGQVIKLP